jgi:hypothetical protein
MSIILSLADRVREHCPTQIPYLQVVRISGKDVARIFGTHNRRRGVATSGAREYRYNPIP